MKVYYLLIIVALTGCNYSKTNSNPTPDAKNSIESIWADEYLECKDEFPDSLVSHFPSNYDESIVVFNTSTKNEPQAIKYLIVVRKVDDVEFNSLNQIEFTSDSCLFSIYLRKNQYGFNYFAYNGCKSLLPVPSKELLLNTYSMESNIRYDIIETSKNVIFHNDIYLRHYLPDDWKNGMSRGIGICLEDNLIIYWLILW